MIKRAWKLGKLCAIGAACWAIDRLTRSLVEPVPHGTATTSAPVGVKEDEKPKGKVAQCN